MSRRDTIIIAVLINAGLLIILFVSALKSHNASQEIVMNTPEASSPMNELAVRPQEASQGDEVDQALHQYAQSASDQEKPTSVATLSAAPAAQEPQGMDSIFAEVQNVASPSLQPFADAALSSTMAAPVEKTEAAILEVTVKKGDVLEKIARANRTTVDEIMKLNHLANTRLKIGQILRMPSKSGKKTEDTSAMVVAKTSAASTPKYYTVKNGDNPWTIAVKNHMKVDELLKLNNLDEEKARRLKPGDRLRIK